MKTFSYFLLLVGLVVGFFGYSYQQGLKLVEYAKNQAYCETYGYKLASIGNEFYCVDMSYSVKVPEK